jgi:hypothetical protein
MGHFFLSNRNKCEFYSDEDFRELLRLATLVAGLNNEIQSYQKDDSWNMVTIWTKIGGKIADQAVEARIRRHFEMVDDYKQLSHRLLERYPKEEMEPWIVHGLSMSAHPRIKDLSVGKVMSSDIRALLLTRIYLNAYFQDNCIMSSMRMVPSLEWTSN